MVSEVKELLEKSQVQLSCIVFIFYIFLFFSFLKCHMSGTLLDPGVYVLVSVYLSGINTTWWEMLLPGVKSRRIIVES